MDLVTVRIINKSRNPAPVYATPGSAGMDLCASLDAPVVFAPFARAIIPTGIYAELPANYEAQVRPRSGLAARCGVTVLNSPGTIDSDYRGEIGVILINLSPDAAFTVRDGDRIAQLVIAPITRAIWETARELAGSARGSGGFGSTDAKK